jgi:hypothetical protein
MSIKPEQVYFESIKNLVRDSHELLNDYINEPSFDDKGELINIPHEKFLSHITQALILTRHYKFIESQSDNSIFRAFSKLRDSTFDESNQQERVTNLIQLLDAIVRQIESGILYFSAGTLHAPAQGSLAQIISTPLLFIENPLRDSISSDISELVVATQSRQYKCIALLAGSIAESVLLGIAKLNPSISQTYLQNPSVKGLKKTFPES